MQEKTAQFRASSGRTVRVTDDGTVVFDHVNGYLSPGSAMDAEEFFQAKRDAELGRWRWPANSDYVVYRSAGRDDYLEVLDERDGDVVAASIAWAREALADGDEPDLAWEQAAIAYVTEHPERKPWHDAKVGEVWALRLGHDEYPEFAVHVIAAPFGVCFQTPGEGTVIDPASSSIVEARKVWPEGAS